MTPIALSVIRAASLAVLIAAPADTMAGDRIVGGKTARIEDWPWQVALMRRDEQFCGGSVIAPSWVLTAAHCIFDGLKREEFGVIEGTSTLSGGGRRVGVSRIVLHPSWNPATMTDDVALLRLAEPLRSPPVRRASPGGDDALTEAGVNATVTGWGLLRPIETRGGARFDALTGRAVSDEEFRDVYKVDRLMKVDITVRPKDECRAAYPGHTLDDRHVCAGDPAGGHDSCQGDSGGPLVARGAEGWAQIGVVSWGGVCGKAGNVGVYTNVAHYDTWIASIIGVTSTVASTERTDGLGIDPEPRSGIELLPLAPGAREPGAPQSRFTAGQQVVFRVRTESPGWLTLLEERPDGTVARLFPNRYTPAPLRERPIQPGRPLLLPNLLDPYDRARFTMPTTAGGGVIVAVFSSIPVEIPADSLTKASQESSTMVVTRLVRSISSSIPDAKGNRARFWGAKINYAITP